MDDVTVMYHLDTTPNLEGLETVLVKVVWAPTSLWCREVKHGPIQDDLAGRRSMVEEPYSQLAVSNIGLDPIPQNRRRIMVEDTVFDPRDRILLQ